MKLNQSLRYILTVLAALVGVSVQAQTDAQFTQYYEMPAFYNPAAIGRTDYVNVRGGARLQWLGVTNAPRSFVLGADMPVRALGRRLAVGAVMGQEGIGLFKTMTLDVRGGYQLKKLGGTWTAALSVGMYDQKFLGTEVKLPDGDDFHQGTDQGVPTTDLHGTALDLGVGVWYEHRLFWAGLSARHITSPTITLNSDAGDASAQNSFQFQAGRVLYFMAGGNIAVKNTLFEVIPSVLVKSDFTFTTAEVNARVRYNRFLSLGAGYRVNDAVTASLAAEIKDFYVGYAYDYPVTAIARASSGSHELVAGYRFKLNMGDKNRNRHKSIRIM